MGTLSINALRQLCWIGLGVALLVDLIRSLPLAGGYGLGIAMLFVFSLAVPLVSILLMPRAADALLRGADILIPLAMVVIASRVVGWLTLAPVLGALFAPSFPLRLFSLSVTLSLSFVIHCALAVAYAAWMTATVVEYVRQGNIDPRSVFQPAMRQFWRFFGLAFIGSATMMLAAIPFLALLPVVPPLAGGGLFIFALVWNFSTAAVLLSAWQDTGGLWTVFRRGMRVSRANLHKWWPVLLAQMLLLGLVIFYFTHSAGQTSAGWTESTTAGWNVNGVWIGGFADQSRWYDNLADAIKAPKLPFVETVLALLLGVLAVIIKIAIVQRLNSEPVSET